MKNDIFWSASAGTGGRITDTRVYDTLRDAKRLIAEYDNHGGGGYIIRHESRGVEGHPVSGKIVYQTPGYNLSGHYEMERDKIVENWNPDKPEPTP